MNIKKLEANLNQETENLRVQLKEKKAQLEVIDILKKLELNNNSKDESGFIFSRKEISPDAMNYFISLLNPDEYVKGYSLYSNYRCDSEQFTRHTDEYLMLLNNEYLLNFTYKVTKYNDYDDEDLVLLNLKKRTEIEASCYFQKIKDLYFACSHDYLQDYKKIINILRVMHSPNGDFSNNKFIGSNSLGYSLFDGEITTIYNVADNLSFSSGTKVEDALTSISSEILMERYLEKLQKQDEKSKIRK